MKELLLPKKIVYSSLVEKEENLLLDKPLQIGLNEKYVTKCKNKGFLVFDFGVEINGSIRILTYSSNNAVIRLRFGESLTESQSEIGVKNATNDHSNRDFKVNLQNYSNMSFGNTGFRFLRIDFEGEVVLKSVVAENNILSQKPIYLYNGNDEKIKEIFNIAKRTVDLCAAFGYVWDGIKRDRLVWVGDMHPEMLALTAIYGRLKVIEDSLDFVKEQSALPCWMNSFPSYSMWWIIIIADYYTRTDCKDYLEKQKEYLTLLLEQMNNCVLDNGEMNYPDYFTDWPTYKTPAAKDGVRAINMLAAKKAKEVLSALGCDTTVAEKLYEKLNKVEIQTYGLKQIIALKYFALGKISEEEKTALLSGGAKGLSSFMSYYILTAIKDFDLSLSIKITKEYFGAMIDKGATTFWEDFNIDWVKDSGNIYSLPQNDQKDIHGDYGAFCYIGFRHSLCHGWASGIASLIKDIDLRK